MGNPEERERAASDLIEELSLDRSLLARGLATGSGRDFLDWLGQYLVDALHVDFAMIGELWGEDWQQVKMLVVRTPQGDLDPFAHDLAGTPCIEVLGRVPWSFPRDVDRQFCDNPFLVNAGVKSCVGVPLIDKAGRLLGLMVLLESRPMSAERVASLTRALELFRGRTERIVANRRARREYSALLSIATYSHSESAFELLLRSLAHALNVRTAWLTQYTDATRERLEVTASSSPLHGLAPIEYDVVGTPGEGLVAGSAAVQASGLRVAFPEFSPRMDFEAQATITMALSGSDGSELGQLVLLHDRPISKKLSGQPLLRAFARRVVTELERQSGEEQRRGMDQKLQAKQRLESLGLLAGGVAHDFNNLLSSILGNAELLRDAGGPRAESEGQLDAIERAAETAADLCRQLLDYAGDRALIPRQVRLNDIVREMVRLQVPSVSKRIHLELDLCEPSPIIEADAGRIRQVVLNLIKNGTDAIGDQPGTLCVRTFQRLLTEEGSGQAELSEWLGPGYYAVLEVQDDGCGMDRETVRSMYDPFFSTKDKGRGLGMAVVLGILKSHKASIQVASEPGQGTTLVVYLPAVEPARAELAPEPLPSASRSEIGAGVVLVVDDEEAVCQVARRMLVSAGFETVTAAGGAQAIDIVRRQPNRFDCLLVDLTMPSLDGLETLDAIREHSPEIGTVLMTGYALPDLTDRIRASNVDATISKPFRRENLLTQIGNALRQRTARR